MNILIVNPNTAEPMTAAIAATAQATASPGTSIVAVQPFFGPEAGGVPAAIAGRGTVRETP
ncbi:MAG TPA: hypothetical protein VE733_02005 [Streptosporangiaceae bacterium]|jgi:allantoin racemase|nr:hypothetical protein [Streptosporangiaceae bacterium]